MPTIKINGKQFHNPVALALDRVGGRWKMPILWRLCQRSPWRYGELKKDIVGISHKMLSQQLKELEADGFVTRKMYAVVPPKVEYFITTRGNSALPAIEELRKFGNWLELDIKKNGK